MRNDEIAEPQTGKEHLAEGLGVHDALVAIDTLQSRQWTTDVTKFAVVVIFDDKGARVACPRQQRQTAWQRKRDTERTLMRRSDHCETRALRLRHAISYAQPFDVDANRDQFCASALERAAHEWVARILEPNLAVATEQDVANQAQRVLVPVGDQDLPRRAGYAAGARNISCNGVP